MMAEDTKAIITAALSNLPPSHLSSLTRTISAVFHHHRRRLSSLLSSPALFSLSLRHLQSLSLPQKSLLISRHLLSNLTLIKYFSGESPPPSAAARMKLRDLDAVLLLLLLCETHHQNPQLLHPPPSQWRVILSGYVSNSVLNFSTFGGFCSSSEILIEYIESISRCWNFVNVMGFGYEGKEGTDVEASTAAVVALPSVEVNGVECVICKEEMQKGREVCELPCKHLFHWMCILRWFKKRNTCPCCRHRLPTDDVRREIERLLEDLENIGGGGGRLDDQEFLEDTFV